MSQDEPFSRRRVLQLTGATAATALIAGCGDGGEGPGDNETGNGEEDEPVENGEEDEPAENGNETGAADNETEEADNETEEADNETEEADNETGEADNETEEADNETEEGNETEEEGGAVGDGEAIEPGTQIEFSGQISGWEGIAPSAIEGEENPTLTLQEGETYEIGWTEGDGATHNIAIRDDGGNVIDDLATETTSDPGDDQWLEFEANSDMVEYVCEPHSGTMVGDIEVQ